MIRVNVVTEGQSELYFVKQILSSYPVENNLNIFIDGRAVLTSTDRRINYQFRGGLADYAKPKADICSWLKQGGTYVTTMFDLFRLPHEFPGYEEAVVYIVKDPNRCIDILEHALKEDICRELPEMDPRRFIPYIQLHEFEALIFSDLLQLYDVYLGRDESLSIKRLIQDIGDMDPESINNGPETAPSKRLENSLPYNKGSDSGIILKKIGISRMRERCPHFSNWVVSLMNLVEL